MAVSLTQCTAALGPQRWSRTPVPLNTPSASAWSFLLNQTIGPLPFNQHTFPYWAACSLEYYLHLRVFHQSSQYFKSGGSSRGPTDLPLWSVPPLTTYS